VVDGNVRQEFRSAYLAYVRLTLAARTEEEREAADQARREANGLGMQLLEPTGAADVGEMFADDPEMLAALRVGLEWP
jgi:hypothetical protein